MSAFPILSFATLQDIMIIFGPEIPEMRISYGIIGYVWICMDMYPSKRQPLAMFQAYSNSGAVQSRYQNVPNFAQLE